MLSIENQKTAADTSATGYQTQTETPISPLTKLGRAESEKSIDLVNGRVDKNLTNFKSRSSLFKTGLKHKKTLSMGLGVHHLSLR